MENRLKDCFSLNDSLCVRGVRSEVPTTFYPQKTARIARLGNYSLKFALCTHPTHENRCVRGSLKATWSEFKGGHLTATKAFVGLDSKVLGQLPPGQLPPGQLPPDNYPPDNYPPRTNTPRTITPPQITEFPKHKSTKFTSYKVYKSQSLQVTKFTSHKVYKSQKVHKLRGQSHNIYEYKFYKIQVSTKVVHGYGKLWSFAPIKIA